MSKVSQSAPFTDPSKTLWFYCGEFTNWASRGSWNFCFGLNRRSGRASGRLPGQRTCRNFFHLLCRCFWRFFRRSPLGSRFWGRKKALWPARCSAGSASQLFFLLSLGSRALLDRRSRFGIRIREVRLCWGLIFYLYFDN